MNIHYLHSRGARSLRQAATLITAGLLLLVVTGSAAEITITLTGTLVGGADQFPVFDAGRDLDGKPFTLVFTFDDTKGKPVPPGMCPNSGSGIEGHHASSPGKAVLTIGTKSYTFGERADSHSSSWKTINSACSESNIDLSVYEGDSAFTNGGNQVDVRLNTTSGSLSQNPDWRAPLSVSKLDRASGAFFISHMNGKSSQAKASFDIQRIVISGSKKTGAGR